MVSSLKHLKSPNKNTISKVENELKKNDNGGGKVGAFTEGVKDSVFITSKTKRTPTSHCHFVVASFFVSLFSHVK